MDYQDLIEIFVRFGRIRVVRMFGARGIYHARTMIALEAQGEIFVKCTKRMALELARAGSKPFTYSRRGKDVALSYWKMPDSALDDPEESAQWAHRALHCARVMARAERMKKARARRRDSA